MKSRRDFVLTSLPLTMALIASSRTLAAEPEAQPLSEDDPVAVALGYRHDATTVDVARFPTYLSGRNCAGCQLYQAGADTPWAKCAVVPGKLVAARGWCSAWVGRA